MNSIFFLIPVLIIGLVPLSFAEVEKGINYDREILANPDGSQSVIWQSIPYERLYDGSSWVDFIQIDTTEINTTYGKVLLDGNGVFTFYGNGGNPLWDDEIRAKYADISDLDSWTYPNALNNDTPDISWNGTALISEKEASGIGNVKYIYSNPGGKWKTQLEATNLSGLDSKVFGFDQIFDLYRDTITFGGVQRNLDNFDGQTFQKQWIENNEAELIQLMNGYNFDLNLAINHLHSITIYDTGPNSSRLIFDYRMDDVLLPNETLVIDPTFGPTDSDQTYYINTLPVGGTSCGGVDTKNTGIMQVFLQDSADSGSVSCRVGAAGFDITSIPDTAFITNVQLHHTVTSITNSGGDCDWNSLESDPSTASASDLYADIQDGTTFVSSDSNCTSTGIYAQNLGSDANTDLQDNLGVDWWGVGVVYDSMTRGASDEKTVWQTTSDVQLEVTYTIYPPPDAVDDLTSPGQTYGSVDLLWTQPALNGGNLTGYQINYSTPWGNPTTIITNNTGTSDTSTIISGLEISTDYTFGVSAWTDDGGNNATKPPMVWLNVTTLGNFTIGTASFNQTNTQTLPITFEEQTINSTAKFLNVTFANTYVMACDFDYKFANTNQTYTGLTSYAVSSTLDETSFVFTNSSNEVIGVLCWDTITGDDARYLMSQSDFPLLQQIADFRSGEFGTAGNFGVYDFVTLLVVIISMIGLNRVNPSVGIVFNIALLGSLSYFEIIELPTIIFGAIAVLMVFVITSTRKSA